jgi:hypothetical protein
MEGLPLDMVRRWPFPIEANVSIVCVFTALPLIPHLDSSNSLLLAETALSFSSIMNIVTYFIHFTK